LKSEDVIMTDLTSVMVLVGTPLWEVDWIEFSSSSKWVESADWLRATIGDVTGEMAGDVTTPSIRFKIFSLGSLSDSFSREGSRLTAFS
jgi:hypothetical protein